MSIFINIIIVSVFVSISVVFVVIVVRNVIMFESFVSRLYVNNYQLWVNLGRPVGVLWVPPDGEVKSWCKSLRATRMIYYYFFFSMEDKIKEIECNNCNTIRNILDLLQ